MELTKGHRISCACQHMAATFQYGVLQPDPYKTTCQSVYLSPVPHPGRLSMPHLLLQLKNAIQQRLRRRRTPRNIDIDRNNPINATHHTIAIVIVPAPIRTAAHANHPLRIGHLVIALPQRGRHFVRHGPGHDHHVCLARGGAEDYTQSVLVVSRHGGLHHFDCAAGEPEAERP